MVRTNRKKGELLRIVQQDETRGRKRKLSESDMKVVKRELKKKRATPDKVAQKLSLSPSFRHTKLCGRTIRNNMKCENNHRKGNHIDFHEFCLTGKRGTN